jgi:Holliday junction resolvase RusA-like endonuclease
MERMTAAEFRREFVDGGVHSPRNTRPIRENDAKTKIRGQAIQKVQTVLGTCSKSIHKGPFRIEVEIVGKCRADIDNVLKGVLDALNGVAYIDDKQCVEARVKLCESEGDL